MHVSRRRSKIIARFVVFDSDDNASVRSTCEWMLFVPGPVGVRCVLIAVEVVEAVQEPVIVEDFHTEKRFQIEPLLDDQDIRSGICVTIPGPRQPLGVLGVCTRKLQSFHQEDIHFLQGIANVLGEYIARHNVETELLEEEARLQAIIEESPAAIYVKDLRGRYILSNKKHKTYCNIETEEIAGKTDYDLFPPEVAVAIMRYSNS